MKRLPVILALLAIIGCSKTEFCHIEDERIVVGDVPQYFVGVDVSGAPEMAVAAPAHLMSDLDTLKALGIRNLSINVAEVDLEGLDFTLAELVKRQMTAVLYFGDDWEWDSAQVKSLVKRFRNNPAIFGWDPGKGDGDYIKSLDHNHLVGGIDYLTFKVQNPESAFLDFQLLEAYRQRKPAIVFGDVSDRIDASAKECGRLAGCFLQKPVDTLPGDICAKLAKAVSVWSPRCDEWLQTGSGPFKLEIDLAGALPLDLELEVDIVTDLSLMSEVRDTVFSQIDCVSAPAGRQRLCYDLPIDPGFYQVNLRIGKPHKNGMHYFPAGQFNIGFNPEQIESPQDKPEDFDEFWVKTLGELASVPMGITLTPEPEHSNELRESFTVSFKSLYGETVGGRLCMPVKEGKYPTYIDYMGYGADPFWYDPSSEPDAVEFLMCVRDQGIFKEGHNDWIVQGLNSREDFYYRGAFCDVKRAVDFVCTLGKVDKDRIMARGESQGGAFTWISASLDDRIDAIAPAVPFLTDYEDYGRIVEWPVWQMYRAADENGIERKDLLEMLKYFDVKNFTDRIKCPVYMAFGLQDPTCPPHTNFAGYNQVKSEKKYYCVPTCGHAIWQEPSWGGSERKKFLMQF